MRACLVPADQFYPVHALVLVADAKTVIIFNKFAEHPLLKDPSQPPPFSMPSKLLIMHGEVKSECFTVGCVPKSSFNYL